MRPYRSLTIIVMLLCLCVQTKADEMTTQLRKANNDIATARNKHDAKDEATARLQRLIVYYNFDLSDSIYMNAYDDLDFAKAHGEWLIYDDIWQVLINAYNFNELKTKGLEEGQRMFDDAIARKDDYGMGMAYYAMGDVYANMNNLEEGAKAYRQSIDLLLKMNEPQVKLCYIFSNYGDVLESMGRYEELEQLTHQWNDFLTKQEKRLSQVNTAEAREELANYKPYWAYYYIACTQALLGLERYEEAAQMLDEAKKRISDDDAFLYQSWLFYRAQLCLKQGFLEEALALNNQRMKMLDEYYDEAMLIRVRKQRAEILTGLKRFEEASALYREMYLINDSINTHATKSQLAEMDTRYQVGELKMAQAEARLRNAIIIASIIVIALAIFIFFRIRAARRLKAAHTKLEEAHGQLLTAYDQLEETTIAKERIESDLRIARDIQMGMVPHTFPERDDLDLYASMTPAKEVGGDLYDFLIIGNKLYFCLGDVSGKGVPASLFMAVARNMFHVLSQQELSPGDIATKLNATLSEDNESCMFVTMFIGVADLETGCLEFCNAGHNPPVLVGDGTTEFLEMIPNSPIGLWPGMEFEGEKLDDISGKTLFVYTDGLNEAENRQQEQFTDERLLEVLETTPFENCKQTVEELRQMVEDFRDGAEPSDDLTMLCLEVIKKT